jgi:hypothetical protein
VLPTVLTDIHWAACCASESLAYAAVVTDQLFVTPAPPTEPPNAPRVLYDADPAELDWR